LKVVFPATEEMVGKIVKVKITKAGYPYNEGQFVRVVEDTLLVKEEVFNKEEAAI
jgi:threonylcarbamoyladenosine tRNA methylthiotransferase MtaB